MAGTYGKYPPVASGGGGGGGITSINTDTTAAQVIAGGTGISVATVAGTTTITASGGSGANTALTNIASVFASADLNPSADGAHSIGTSSNRWDKIYGKTWMGVGADNQSFNTGANYAGFAVGTAGTSTSVQFYVNASNSGSLTFGTGASYTLAGGGSNIAAFGIGNSSIYVNNAQVYQFNNGDIRFFFADLKIYSAGRGLAIKEGANARLGLATLVAGTVTVANTTITSSTRIFLTAQDNNTTGALRVSAMVAGTSFTITSSNAGDTGVVAYNLIEAL